MGDPWEKYSDPEALRVTLPSEVGTLVRTWAQHHGLTTEQVVTMACGLALYDHHRFADALRLLRLAGYLPDVRPAEAKTP